MLVTIYTEKGKRPYDIPFTVFERTFGKFCDFKTAEQKYWEITRLASPEYRYANKLPALTAAEELDQAANIAQAFIDMMSIIVEGDLSLIEFNNAADSMSALIDGGYVITPDSDITLTRLYAHWINCVNKYIPDDVPTEIRMNIDGTMCKLTEERALTLLFGEGTLTGQFLESLEYRRRAVYLTETLRTGDAGNIDFNLGLTEMALLVIPENEQLPHKRAHLNAYINKYKKKWEHVPLDEVLRVRFFLVAIIKNWLANKYMNAFLPLNKVSVPKRQQVESNKPNWKRQQT